MIVWACAGRDLTFLLVSYGVNAAMTLGLLAYMTRQKAGVAGIWACLLLFQVSLLLLLLLVCICLLARQQGWRFAAGLVCNLDCVSDVLLHKECHIRSVPWEPQYQAQVMCMYPCPAATSHISTSCALQSSADVSMHSTAKVDRVWCRLRGWS